MVGSYNYGWVAASFLVAVMASYSALDLGGRVTGTRGRPRICWLVGGAITLGIGIWSMHYVGMLAFSLPVPIHYYWPTVLLSLLAGIISSTIALLVVSRPTMGSSRVLAGSLFMGAGIAALHYLAMESMRLMAVCSYSPALVTLSVLVAIGMSFLSLRLTFLFRDEAAGRKRLRAASALLMGFAIAGMHYSGMAAARFTPSAVVPDLFHVVDISALGMTGIGIVTQLVLGLAVLTSLVDRLQKEESAVRTLTGRLLSLKDEEGRRLARELHDSTAQLLAALSINLSVVNEAAGPLEPRARQAIAESIKLADQCLGEIRIVAYLLHPPELDELGLNSALARYVEGFAQRSGIQAEMMVPSDLGRLPQEVETALFRIVQECLTNIHRHSGSHTASVRIVRTPSNLMLEVKDAGKGIPGRASPGVGIASMKERVQQLSGRLEVSSDRDGTTINVIIPLSKFNV